GVGLISRRDEAGRTRLLTFLGVFSLGAVGARLEAIAPHATGDEVRARTGFPFEISESLTTLADPPDDALAAIRELDPLHLRAELVGRA
ncbi:MAG: CoA-transferase subunit beta, partial [Kofleriaceae bacterium]